MATVPNWIAKGYAVSGRGDDACAYRITDWRATTTQVVVILDINGRPVEYRFRLDDLTEVGRRYGGMKLVAPDADVLAEIRRAAKIRSARFLLDDAVEKHNAFMRRGNCDVESVVASISNVQRAATKAMADLADLL